MAQMAPLFWNPDEADSGACGTVERHSKGMISFAYNPPSEADLGALREKYRRLLEKVGTESSGVTPREDEAAKQG